MKKHHTNLSPKKVSLWKRRERAMQLRSQGMTLNQIAQMMRGKDGVSKLYSHEGVRKDLKAYAKAEMERLSDTSMAEHRFESLRMLSTLMTFLHSYLKSLPPQQALGAIDRIVKIDAERRKILGVDAPLKVAQTDINGNEKLLEPPVFTFEVYETEQGTVSDEVSNDQTQEESDEQSN